MLTVEDAAASGPHTHRLDISNVEIDGNDEQGYQSYIDVGQKHEDERQHGTRHQRQNVDKEAIDSTACA